MSLPERMELPHVEIGRRELIEVPYTDGPFGKIIKESDDFLLFYKDRSFHLAKRNPFEWIWNTPAEKEAVEFFSVLEVTKPSIYEREMTALENLFNRITAIRMGHYNPKADPSVRGDLVCLCCGEYYRPDDLMDGVNVYICLTCIRENDDARA